MRASVLEIRADYEERIARMREDFESRDQRRSSWCRKVVDTLVNALRECRSHSVVAEPEADHALRLAEKHREHHGDDDFEDERRGGERS
jgi:hypothetical protein